MSVTTPVPDTPAPTAVTPRAAINPQAVASTHAPQVEKILLATPRGFCAGVEMAIKALAIMVHAFEPPIYCYHEIVHNKLIVQRFENLGVKFVNDISEVPEGAPLMLSAHGSAPEVVAQAHATGGYVVDSVCPLVTKVHHEVKVRAKKGYQIVYIGHLGHEEAAGTIAVAPENIHLVESVEDVDSLPQFGEQVALLAQTTLSQRDWADIAATAQQKYADMWTPGRSDLCFATTNRQAALEAFAPRCDSFVIVGSANSSNTRALEKLANQLGCERVFRVNTAEELPDNLYGTVGVTAGASAPDELVQEVVELLDPVHGTEEISAITEDEYFPPPRQLRELISAIANWASATLGGQLTDGVSADRQVDASAVLAAMSPRKT